MSSARLRRCNSSTISSHHALKMPVIDLHVHSSCSDGVHTPEEIVAPAQQSHVNVLSITDIKKAQGRFPENLLYLPGLEVPVVSEVDRSEQHLCVYFPFLAIANKFPFELKFESTILHVHQPEENQF